MSAKAEYVAREIADVDSPSTERNIMKLAREMQRGYAKNQAAIRLGKDWRLLLVLRGTAIPTGGR
jgi:hypothetical protein